MDLTVIIPVIVVVAIVAFVVYKKKAKPAEGETTGVGGGGKPFEGGNVHEK